MRYRLQFCSLLFVPLGLSILACSVLSPRFKPAVIITLAPDTSANITPDSLNVARRVLQSRLNEVSEKQTRVLVNEDNLQVELSSADDLTTTIQLANQIGAVVFFDWDSPVSLGATAPDHAKTVLTDEDVSHAKASFSSETIGWEVAITLTSNGAEKLKKYTEANAGRYVVITHDNIVIACPVVRTTISNGEAAIVDHFDKAYSQSLAAQLNSGRLPFILKVVEKN